MTLRRIHNPDGTVTETEIDEPSQQEFKTLTASEFIALLSSVLGFARVDEFLAKSKTVEALIIKAEKVDRLTGNTPAAISFLKTGDNPLTDQEMESIDVAWRTL